MRLRYLILIAWLALYTGPALAAATVVVVSSERGGAYSEAAEALLGELEREGLPRQEVLHVVATEWSAAGALSPRLFVALGTQAADVLARSELRAPMLATLLPRASFEHILRLSGRKPSSQFSALYLDQPLSRQLELARLALPGVNRIGVLWGPQSSEPVLALKALADAKGLQLADVEVAPPQPLFPALRRVLAQADLLLALPDPQVYSSASIQNILLTSFRVKVPVMAFSPAYVRAGALLAVYVTPAQIGFQAAAMAHDFLQGKALPAAPIYSSDFQVAVNEHVARSLGLALDAELLRQRLRRSEAKP